jgi:hypothetical protein
VILTGKLFALIIWVTMAVALVVGSFSPIATGDGIAALATVCLIVGVIIAFLGLVHDSGGAE